MEAKGNVGAQEAKQEIKEEAKRDAGLGSLPFLTATLDRATGTYRCVLTRPGLDVLRLQLSATARVYFLWVGGQARKGKTTLLNYLLQMLGVPVSARRRFVAGWTNDFAGVTEGILIWATPLRLPAAAAGAAGAGGAGENVAGAANNDDQYVMLLDVQGSGVGDELLNQQMAAVACALSTVMVFNVDARFTNRDVQLLRQILTMLRKLTRGLAADAADRDEAIPALVVRFRDYNPQMLRALLGKPANAVVDLARPETDVELDALMRQTFEAKNARLDDDTRRCYRHVLATFGRKLHLLVTMRPTDAQQATIDAHGIALLPAAAPAEAAEHGAAQRVEEAAFVGSMEVACARLLRLCTTHGPKRFGGAAVGPPVLVEHLQPLLDSANAILANPDVQFDYRGLVELLQLGQLATAWVPAALVAYRSHYDALCRPPAVPAQAPAPAAPAGAPAAGMPAAGMPAAGGPPRVPAGEQREVEAEEWRRRHAEWHAAASGAASERLEALTAACVATVRQEGKLALGDELAREDLQRSQAADAALRARLAQQLRAIGETTERLGRTTAQTEADLVRLRGQLAELDAGNRQLLQRLDANAAQLAANRQRLEEAQRAVQPIIDRINSTRAAGGDSGKGSMCVIL